MDTQRLILFVIFSFSALFLWEAWQREQYLLLARVSPQVAVSVAGARISKSGTTIHVL